MPDHLPPEAALLETLEAGWAAEDQRQRLGGEADAIRACCATLAGFVRKAWPTLEPDRPLVWSWHMDAVCDHLQAVTDGRITRLLVNIPPGFSKSLLVSVMWPAWEWAQGLRSLRYLTTSFSEANAKRDTRKMRDLVQSAWYRSLWPEVLLTRNGELSFANADTGGREASAFGSLTGQRADRLIIDDPHSTQTAESDTERTATVRLFREGATNRLNDQARSAIVVVMQRLHSADLSGAILELGGWTHLCLPMEFDPDRRCETSIGFRDPRERDGELLDPRRFPPAVVEALKRDMGSHAYAGQYGQAPTPRDGGLFKRNWFEFVGAGPAKAQRTRAWDFAASTKASADWTVGLRLARDEEGLFYVEGVERGRLSPGEVQQLVLSTAQGDPPGTAVRLPQDPGQAGKAQADAFVRLLAGFDVKAKPPSGDKITRATPAAAQAEAGNIKIVKSGDPTRDAWIEPFLDEVCLFPAGAHDDQVDALADALNNLAGERIAAWGAYEWMRQEAEALERGRQMEQLTLTVPPGIGAVRGMSGQNYCVEDGLVTVSAEDAAPLRASGWQEK